jgi:hypothetical protein
MTAFKKVSSSFLTIGLAASLVALFSGCDVPEDDLNPDARAAVTTSVDGGASEGGPASEGAANVGETRVGSSPTAACRCLPPNPKFSTNCACE